MILHLPRSRVIIRGRIREFLIAGLVLGQPVRLLCICSPAGQEEFFKEVGIPVATRTTPPPKLDKEQQRQFMEKAMALAPKYKTELLREP